MALPKICTVDGCDKPEAARGWCGVHYNRWYRHGDPLAGRTERGAIPRFIRDTAAPYAKDDCLKWPFNPGSHGYGLISSGGKPIYAHRLICEIVHGPAPTPQHQAAHSCGKGRDGCVNPRHLRWATPVENMADQLAHGTLARGERVGTAKLTAGQVLEIRRLSGVMSQRAIARLFGVGRTTVKRIHLRQGWAWLE